MRHTLNISTRTYIPHKRSRPPPSARSRRGQRQGRPRRRECEWLRFAPGRKTAEFWVIRRVALKQRAPPEPVDQTVVEGGLRAPGDEALNGVQRKERVRPGELGRATTLANVVVGDEC